MMEEVNVFENENKSPSLPHIKPPRQEVGIQWNIEHDDGGV
jgi:hypothetical protein